MKKQIKRTAVEAEVARLNEPSAAEWELARAGSQWLGRDRHFTHLSNALTERRRLMVRGLKAVLAQCPGEVISVRKLVAELGSGKWFRTQSWTVYGERVLISNRKSSRNTLRLLVLNDGETPEGRIAATNWIVL